MDISPEEILKRKEIEGGIKYDDPDLNGPQDGYQDITNEIPKAMPIMDNDPVMVESPSKEFDDELKDSMDLQQQTSLGKATSYSEVKRSDLGWKNLPVDILPSKGMFYPEGTRIAIRPAEVKEIRHFSSIDESDRLDLEEKLSYILDRCMRMEYSNEGVVSYRDLKQEDRFFVIMAIRDLTFVSGENSIILMPEKKCKSLSECPFVNGIELRTGVLSSYTIDGRIMKYYNESTRSFIFDVPKIGRKIEMNVPSIGVNELVTRFILYCKKKSIEIDEGFIKIAPFIIKDWRGITEDMILNKMRESDYWTKEEYSLYFELSDMIKIGTILEVKQICPKCGGEVTADISFPSGFRSLFVISDIFGELLGY
jgi:hypothetical protein